MCNYNYQCKLQEESHTIDLLSIKIDKYENLYCSKNLKFTKQIKTLEKVFQMYKLEG